MKNIIKKITLILIIGAIILCIFSNSNNVDAKTAKFGHSNFKLILENIDYELTYRIQFSIEDSFTSQNHYEILTISQHNGKILDATKKDCGYYSYSGGYNEYHEYDILEKVKIEKNNNSLIILIEDLNNNEIGNYNTITVFKNEIEILKTQDNDYFVDKTLTTCDDGYNVYTYHNVEINFNKNEITVLKEREITTQNNYTKIALISVLTTLAVLIIIVIFKIKK